MVTQVVSDLVFVFFLQALVQEPKQLGITFFAG